MISYTYTLRWITWKPFLTYYWSNIASYNIIVAGEKQAKGKASVYKEDGNRR